MKTLRLETWQHRLEQTRIQIANIESKQFGFDKQRLAYLYRKLGRIKYRIESLKE